MSKKLSWVVPVVVLALGAIGWGGFQYWKASSGTASQDDLQALSSEEIERRIEDALARQDSSAAQKLMDLAKEREMSKPVAGNQQREAVLKCLRDRDLKGLQKLIADGLDPNVRVQPGWPLILEVAAMGLEWVKPVVEAGGNANAQGSYFSWTPLLLASAAGDVETVSYLIARGADVDDSNIEGKTALHLAAEFGHVGVLKVIFPKCRNKVPTTNFKITPLDLALKSEKTFRALTALYGSQRMDWRHGLTQTDSLLHSAVGAGDVGVVKFLLREGFNPNATDEQGRTPIFSAINPYIGIDPVMVQLLVDAGAKLDQVDRDGKSALENYREGLLQQRELQDLTPLGVRRYEKGRYDPTKLEKLLVGKSIKVQSLYPPAPPVQDGWQIYNPLLLEKTSYRGSDVRQAISRKGRIARRVKIVGSKAILSLTHSADSGIEEGITLTRLRLMGFSCKEALPCLIRPGEEKTFTFPKEAGELGGALWITHDEAGPSITGLQSFADPVAIESPVNGAHREMTVEPDRFGRAVEIKLDPPNFRAVPGLPLQPFIVRNWEPKVLVKAGIYPFPAPPFSWRMMGENEWKRSYQLSQNVGATTPPTSASIGLPGSR